AQVPHAGGALRSSAQPIGPRGRPVDARLGRPPEIQRALLGKSTLRCLWKQVREFKLRGWAFNGTERGGEIPRRFRRVVQCQRWLGFRYGGENQVSVLRKPFKVLTA